MRPQQRLADRVASPEQCDQRYADYNKHSRADEFSTSNQISESLPRHKNCVGEARPCRESNQATIRRWVTGCQQQENAECDINAEHSSPAQALASQTSSRDKLDHKRSSPPRSEQLSVHVLDA